MVDCSANARAPESQSGKKRPERACKPNPVPGPGLQRTLRSFESPAGVAIIPLGPRSPSGSSSRPGDVPREAGRDGRPPSPYLALLRMGFAVPPPLPSGRCALTAPFHPYRPIPERNRKAVSFLWHFPSRCRDRVLPGMLPVRSSDFPPRLPGAIAWPARSRGYFSMAPRRHAAPRSHNVVCCFRSALFEPPRRRPAAFDRGVRCANRRSRDSSQTGPLIPRVFLREAVPPPVLSHELKSQCEPRRRRRFP